MVHLRQNAPERMVHVLNRAAGCLIYDYVKRGSLWRILCRKTVAAACILQEHISTNRLTTVPIHDKFDQVVQEPNA
jgi:hypothetical protein